MGGKGSGVTRKPRRLPRKKRDGAIARLDGRRPDVRIVRDGVAAIAEDRGGESEVSFLARRVAHRAMHLDVLLMRDEAAMATGGTVNVAEYLAGVTAWLRYVQALGLHRKARNVQSLQQYIANKAQQKEAAP